MRAVVQRVSAASVAVDGAIVGQIACGLLVLVGVTHGDGEREVEWLAEKLANLRIFEDQGGKMNASLLDAGGAALVVSQFTLYGDARKGNRPSFIDAARPEQAIPLYESVAAHLRARNIPVETGRFGAHMAVNLTNDGPVTIILDTK